MRRLYIIVATLFILSVLIFIASFIYIDKTKHKACHYIVNVDGHDIGLIKLDKFVTDEKLIYKSVSDIPFYPLFTEYKARLDLDRRFNIETYYKESIGNGFKETLYLENRDDSVSFVSTFSSKFACLEKMPFKKGAFVFEEDSPMTYLPIIENYDFRKGRSQGFNAITHFSSALPPIDRYVTLTSIADEYLKIDSRKIKTEHLLLKMKNYPQGDVWVAKSDRCLIALEIPKARLKIRRTFTVKTFEAKEYLPKEEGYISRGVEFKSKGIDLSGTLTVPKTSGKRPAVLLVAGLGDQDRQYQGLFSSIADYLGRNGIAALRFDKRGVGQSKGDASSVTDSDETEDATAAFEYLAGQKEIDANKIFILGHSEGAFYALKIASKNNNVKGLILMAPVINLGSEYYLRFEDKKRASTDLRWSEKYLNLSMKATLETLEKVKNTKGKRTSILGNRCFLSKIREEIELNPMETVKKIQIPVLILQGSEDNALLLESASLLDKTLEEGGNKDHALMYFGYLGRFFGIVVNDGVHKIHYEIDKGAMDNIKDWINRFDFGSNV